MPVVLAQQQTAQRMEEQIWGKLFFSIISVERKYFSNWANSNSQSGLEDTMINSVFLNFQRKLLQEIQMTLLFVMD